MVKKLKYLLFFVPFLFTLNVNAMLLGAPTSYAHFDDDTTIGPSTATTVGYWGSNNYYKSPYLMGGVSSGSYVKQVDFHWNNSNLCPNDDISISGSIAGIYNLFTDQSTSLLAYNNNSAMACVTSIQAEGSRLDYSCYGKGGGTLSMYVQMNSFAPVKQYEIGVTRDMTVSCDASNLDVIQNATNNTNSIINNNNQNTQSIIDNQNQNNQSIIDNQNENQKQTNELLGDCSINNYISTTVGSISASSGTWYREYSVPSSEYSNMKKGRYYWGFNVSSIAYTQPIKATLLIFYSDGTPYQEIDINTTDNTHYQTSFNINSDNISNILIRFLRPQGSSNSFSRSGTFSNIYIGQVSNPTDYTLMSKTCTSKLDKQTDAINGLNDSITSEQNPNTNQDISDMNDMIASNTPITDLLTLPMTLINAYYNGINASCSPYNFGNFLGTDIIFPCINLENRLGHNLWMIIDSLCSIFIIYSIAMLFVHAFDSLTSLKDDFDDMYVPRHAGKHVGGGFNG